MFTIHSQTKGRAAPKRNSSRGKFRTWTTTTTTTIVLLLVVVVFYNYGGCTNTSSSVGSGCISAAVIQSPPSQHYHHHHYRQPTTTTKNTNPPSPSPPPTNSIVTVGLRNLGNTCYMNAQLQCAYHIPLVRHLVLVGEDVQATTNTKRNTAASSSNNNTVDCTNTRETTTITSIVHNKDTFDDDDRTTVSTTSTLSSTNTTSCDEKDHTNATKINSYDTTDATTTQTNDPQQNESDNRIGRHTNNRATTSIALLSLRHVFYEMGQMAALQSPNRATSVVAPYQLCSNLNINVWQQQDTHEFWKLLLPALQLPVLQNLYAGQYIDYLIALHNPNQVRRRWEKFWDLSIPIGELQQQQQQQPSSDPDKELFSIHTSLQSMFGTPELLSVQEGNGWRPERKADPVDAHKGCQLLYTGLPSILQIHLKRFQYNWDTETTIKLNHPFEFPLSLDLTELLQKDRVGMKEDNKNTPSSRCQYELQSVVIHAGEFGSGHYYAYVRPNILSSDWYRFNDEIVEAVDWDDVVRDAYGGKGRLKSSATTSLTDNSEQAQTGNCVQRWIRKFWYTGNEDEVKSYGYGGPKSSAYVLQYVRRCDISKLYNIP